jgi:hypothetical protein
MTTTDLQLNESKLRAYERAGLLRGVRLLATLGALVGVSSFALGHLTWGSLPFKVVAVLFTGGLLDLVFYVARTSKRFSAVLQPPAASLGPGVSLAR